MNSSSISPSPSRLSRTQSGAALTIFAVVLGWTPWFGGPNPLWSLALLIGGAALFSNRLPDRIQSTLAPIFALVVVAQAFHLWYLGLGWLPWLLAAVLLAGEEWRRLDWTNWRRSYRLYVPLGVAICLLSLLSTWDQTPGYSTFGWMGGMQMQSYYNAFTHSIEMRSTYNPILYTNNYFWPGFEYSGRAVTGAIWTEIGLLAMLCWTMWRNSNAQFRSRLLPLVTLALIALWALPAARSSYAAPHWFLLGLALTAFGIWNTGMGQQRGACDPSDVAQRVRNRIG